VTRRPPRGRNQPQPLADLVENCLAPALVQKGFSQADLILHWPDIVGARLGEFCQPIALQWPRISSDSPAAAAASLVVRVDGAFALELQHMAAVVIERVNCHLGWRGVGRLILKQGPLESVSRPRQAHAPVSPASLALARQTTERITDTALREALDRLGARVFDAKR
jgi:hypothetical protein